MFKSNRVNFELSDSADILVNLEIVTIVGSTVNKEASFHQGLIDISVYNSVNCNCNAHVDINIRPPNRYQQPLGVVTNYLAVHSKLQQATKFVNHMKNVQPYPTAEIENPLND